MPTVNRLSRISLLTNRGFTKIHPAKIPVPGTDFSNPRADLRRLQSKFKWTVAR